MKKNKLAILREKLKIYNEKYLDKDFLDKLLEKFAPNYKIRDLVRYGLIKVIKRWKYYLNNLSDELENPYKIIDLYFEWKTYMFWWLWVYNMYDFSTQIIDRFTVYNTTFSWEKKICNYRYIFKKERPSFFYGMTTVKSWNYTYKVMSPERAFIQMLKEWKKFNNLPLKVKKTKLLNLAKKYAPKYILSKIKEICL
jgi:hypothetical protein